MSLVCAYNGLAVLGEGGFDEHGSQGEAQGAVRVADAQLPARRAALRSRHIETCSGKTHLHLLGERKIWLERDLLSVGHIFLNSFCPLRLMKVGDVCTWGQLQQSHNQIRFPRKGRKRFFESATDGATKTVSITLEFE